MQRDFISVTASCALLINGNSETVYEVISIISNPKRVAILSLLRTSPHNLTELAEKLQISPQEIRRYLIMLENRGLIKRINNDYKITVLGDFCLKVVKCLNSKAKMLSLLAEFDASIPCTGCINKTRLLSKYENHVKNRPNILKLEKEGPSLWFNNGLCYSFLIASHPVIGYVSVLHYIIRVISGAKQYLKIAARGAELFPIEYPNNVKVQILVDNVQKKLPALHTEYGSFQIELRVYEGELPFNLFCNERETLLIPTNSNGRPVGDVAISCPISSAHRKCEWLFDALFHRSKTLNEIAKT